MEAVELVGGIVLAVIGATLIDVAIRLSLCFLFVGGFLIALGTS